MESKDKKESETTNLPETIPNSLKYLPQRSHETLRQALAYLRTGRLKECDDYIQGSLESLTEDFDNFIPDKNRYVV